LIKTSTTERCCSNKVLHSGLRKHAESKRGRREKGCDEKITENKEKDIRKGRQKGTERKEEKGRGRKGTKEKRVFEMGRVQKTNKRQNTELNIISFKKLNTCFFELRLILRLTHPFTGGCQSPVVRVERKKGHF
jgi:hypothetical protein